MHISIASVRLYNVCIAPMPIHSLVAWCLEMRAVLPPNLEKKLLFIGHMNKVINNFKWQYKANFNAFQEPDNSAQNRLTS
jgi:hypothetical protein